MGSSGLRANMVGKYCTHRRRRPSWPGLSCLWPALRSRQDGSQAPPILGWSDPPAALHTAGQHALVGMAGLKRNRADGSIAFHQQRHGLVQPDLRRIVHGRSTEMALEQHVQVAGAATGGARDLLDAEAAVAVGANV